MILRNSLSKLLKWKELESRKPLIIRGARQVGKTTLVREFSKDFSTYIELNLERDSERRLFELEGTEKILNAIFLSKNTSPKTGQTLLFIDEIQESPRAITQLRYFLEDSPDLFVIAAGSLLEFALSKIPSFPVGRVDYLYLHPLNFEEFLLAMGQLRALESLRDVPVPEYAHQILKEHFHQYALIGGMPALVSDFAQNKNVEALSSNYRKLWQAYKDDVEKYAKNETEKRIIRHVIDTAPFELDRIKFEGFGNSNYKSREVGEALRALDLARIIQLIYPTTSVKPPIVIDFKKRPRLQFLDTGLWNQAMGLQAQLIQVGDLDEVHKGRIVQHLVAQEINSTVEDYYSTSNFWVRQEKDSNSEVDLIFPFEKYLIPVEVKSGSKGTLRSLHQYMDRCEHPYAVRVYAGEFKIEPARTIAGTDFYLMNLPYYLGTQLEKYVRRFVNKYSSSELGPK
ncbi:ATP-binding protein [Algoriphagus yeomjeoni]|uniref:ATP-binding protein n=1 Tax=Algoriphagus yeomjeoni TaxID=291403 RepID=UPI003CE46019